MWLSGKALTYKKPWVSFPVLGKKKVLLRMQLLYSYTVYSFVRMCKILLERREE
jgi:hypothetical protein